MKLAGWGIAIAIGAWYPILMGFFAFESSQ